MQASWEDPPPPRGGRGGGGGAPQFAMPTMTPGVRALVFTNAAVFIGMFLLSIPAATEPVKDGLVRWFGIAPGTWREWFPLLPVWQIVTWGFLHSVVDPMHILMNMLMLYFLGTMLEGIIGTQRFLVTYVSALLVSGTVVLVTGLLAGPDTGLAELGLPVASQYIPTIGASGAVFCVVIAMAMLRPTTRVIFILFPITLRTLAIMYVGLNLFQLAQSFKGGMASNVSYSAHLAGAAWGFLLVKKGWVWRDPVQAFGSWRAGRRSSQEQGDEERLDTLLRKINREGIHALSAREKAFLKRASKRR